TLSTTAPTYTGDKSAAEIATSKDGRFIYVSNRGEDSVVVYALDERTGMLTQIQRVSAEGKSPWSFSIAPSGRWMIVADEASSSLVVLKLDPISGKLSSTGETLAAPKPVNVVFYPLTAQ
ncbi:MAG: lactonase family protein, partial [Caulobacteraceae bacterium]